MIIDAEKYHFYSILRTQYHGVVTLIKFLPHTHIDSGFSQNFSNIGILNINSSEVTFHWTQPELIFCPALKIA
jgi:hypothetical protein